MNLLAYEQWTPADRVKGLHLDTRWHLSVMPQKRFLLQMDSLARSYLQSCLPLRSNCFPSVCHAGTRACPQFFTVEVATQILTSLRYTDWDIQYTYYIYMFYTHTHTHVWGFPSDSAVKSLPAMQEIWEAVALIPGLGRSPAEGNGNPL